MQSKNLKKLRENIKNGEAVFLNLESEKSALLEQQKGLKKQGLEYGTIAFKQELYMLILLPTTPQGARPRKYIGIDKQKQEDALDAIRRGELFDQLTKEINAIDDMMERIENAAWNFAIAA